MVGKVEINLSRDGNKVWLSGIAGCSSSEKVSSVHAALEAVMRAHGEDFSYDHLVGIKCSSFIIR